MPDDMENVAIGCNARYGDNAGHQGDIEINSITITS